MNWRLYLIEILHQTTTPRPESRAPRPLYLIEILHQTTTFYPIIWRPRCCILSKFYIKPQPRGRRRCRHRRCILSKFYIKPQQIGERIALSRVVSYRNSTSNHNSLADMTAFHQLYLIEILHQTTTFLHTHHDRLGCILSKFYIKPQLRLERELACCSCILSKFYIKPQRHSFHGVNSGVVSYRNSTSNHNSGVGVNATMSLYLIEILHQTTTQSTVDRNSAALYLIEILHQTTTKTQKSASLALLYLIEILHQTTTCKRSHSRTVCCILSKFYIKPQHYFNPIYNDIVVSYRNSTSNHNSGGAPVSPGAVVSYRNSTSNHNFYCFVARQFCVVSYRNSTSNHNQLRCNSATQRLYLIEILHQTTTYGRNLITENELYLIEILHQTTTNVDSFLFCYTLYLIEILHQTTTAKAG